MSSNPGPDATNNQWKKKNYSQPHGQTGYCSYKLKKNPGLRSVSRDEIFHQLPFGILNRFFTLENTELRYGQQLMIQTNTPSKGWCGCVFDHGYVGQMPIVPLHEGLGIDYATTPEGVQTFTDLMWPAGNHSFCERSLSFAKAVAELENIVIRMLFESYGVGRDVDSHIEATTYLLRFLKYRMPEERETTMAFPSHTDKSFITILYQNNVSGLEIRATDGEWINVTFPPSSFVVMAGDACKAWSNDKVFSPNHKVSMDKTGKGTRFTVALFSFLTKTVQVPEELLDDDDEHPLKFKPFSHVDLLNFYNTDQGRRSQNLLQDFCGV